MPHLLLKSRYQPTMPAGFLQHVRHHIQLGHIESSIDIQARRKQRHVFHEPRHPLVLPTLLPPMPSASAPQLSAERACSHAVPSCAAKCKSFQLLGSGSRSNSKAQTDAHNFAITDINAIALYAFSPLVACVSTLVQKTCTLWTTTQVL